MKQIIDIDYTLARQRQELNIAISYFRRI